MHGWESTNPDPAHPDSLQSAPPQVADILKITRCRTRAHWEEETKA
jgi:hypothetical protein